MLFTAHIGILQLLNKQGLLNVTIVVSLNGHQNVKIVPFDVVSSCFNVISNSRRVPGEYQKSVSPSVCEWFICLY